MEVRAGRVAGRADEADLHAAVEPDALPHVDPGEVPVPRSFAVAVRDDDEESVAGRPPGEHDLPGASGVHRRSFRRADVDAGLELVAAWPEPIAERRPLQRPRERKRRRCDRSSQRSERRCAGDAVDAEPGP